MLGRVPGRHRDSLPSVISYADQQRCKLCELLHFVLLKLTSWARGAAVRNPKLATNGLFVVQLGMPQFSKTDSGSSRACIQENCQEKCPSAV